MKLRCKKCWTILLAFDETTRVQIIHNILNELDDLNAEGISEIREMLGGDTTAPEANIDEISWNSERLNNYLSEIDNCISISNYERSITLSYTCVEGFYKSFMTLLI